MTTLDLGTIESTLLLFGGPYSNLQATLAVRRRAQQFGIPPSHIICTGDSVAYCAQPNETLELIQDWGIRLLMGNCEESLAQDADNCGCGFEVGTACDALSASWYHFAVANVNPFHKQWMRNLPRQIVFSYSEKRFIVVHGGVGQINQFVFPSTAAEEKLRQIHQMQVDGVIAGHSGIPFTQILGDKLWHNPGVIGMPANDGMAVAWYALWHLEGGRIRIEHCSLRYDFLDTQSYMREVGLNNGYADALATGLWPSMDVLPAPERKIQAQPINESVFLF